MSSLLDRIEVAETIAISGHVRPDGDCVGSTTGLYHYIVENYPNKKVYLTLENASASVQKCIDCSMIMSAAELPEDIDLFVSLDSSSLDRLGDAADRFNNAKERFVVDHHKTNSSFGDYNEVVPEASSCCEVLYDLLDEEKISYKVAVSLYLGIVHDTGGFKYSSTSKHTMEIAGKLLDKGIDSAFIIDTSFYERSWIQNKLMARAISNAEITEDGFVAYTVISQKDLADFNATSADTDGIVEQLRLTEDVEIAMFVREDAENTYKVSLRAKKGLIDVSEISVMYNGGGHAKAAGFTAYGNVNEIIDNILSEISKRK